MKIIDEVQKRLKKFFLYGYQRRLLLDFSRYRIVLKARQIGFTFFFAFEALVHAHYNNRNQLFSSASGRQSEIFVRYAQEIAEQLKISLKPRADKLVLSNGTFLQALPKNWRSVEGFQGDVYYDEAAINVDFDKIFPSLFPSITSVNGRITVFSRPYAKFGRYYDMWVDDKNYHSYSRHKIDIYDAMDNGYPNIHRGLDPMTPEEQELFIQDLKDGMGDPDDFAVFFLCQFVDDQESYIPLSSVEPLLLLERNDDPRRPIWLGVDVGRTRDATEIIAIGKNLEDPNRIDLLFNDTLLKTPFGDQLDHLNAIFQSYDVQKCVIDKTFAPKLTEDLRAKHGSRVLGVRFDQKKKERMATMVKRVITQKEVTLLKDRVLAQQISAVKRIAGASGFKYDAPRNEKLGHADKFWALALSLIPLKGKRQIRVKEVA